MAIPDGLPTEQKAAFDRAVGAFRGERPIRVTPEKLTAYLNDTRDVGSSPAQRLRWLAIALERLPFESGWAGLQAIYRAAAEADPTDPWVRHSWGLSASRWLEVCPASVTPEERRAVANEAEGALFAALEFAPRDSRIAHTLGLLYYDHLSRIEDREVSLDRAIEWFTRATEWEPGDVLARLYLAHCFHDREDWDRDIAEYAQVDLARLARDWPAWRAVKCREQLAHCHAGAGHSAEATRLFAAFLDDAESWDDSQAEESISDLDELVDAVTRKLDSPALLRRARELVQRLATNPRTRWFEKRYQQLFAS